MADYSSTSRDRKKVIYRDRIVNQDDGEGNWLVSYADMMTLLFGFFVILSAFSTPDAGKMEKLKQETARSMGVSYSNPYEDLSRAFSEVLEESKLSDEVEMQKTDEGVTIVSRGTLFFDSGAVELKDQAETLLNRIGDVLVKRGGRFRVVVEGHTDDSPMVSVQFPSNWELSAARASTVVRLLETKGFPHDRLKPVGLADTEPVVANRSGDGKPITANQALNRRIVIRVLRELPKRIEASPSRRPS